MGQLALLIDLGRCIGCNACEVACKLEHHLGPGQFRTRILAGMSAASGRLEFVVAVCQQCHRPGCLRACGAGAITKRGSDGVVVVDRDRCTGCQECVKACPYGVMGFDPVNKWPDKCTLSLERREAGLPPACVAVCPTQALAIGTREELLERASRERRAIRDVDHFGLGSSTVYLESWLGPLIGSPAATAARESEHDAK